ncbi:helix-turn-helix domain-containing protein [Nonomuraea wenchangensis]|uniref:helix-turn-helix domain-containing protein n=1 Tax=Nonomuraea wenchangensis TaxID=568860 RepID=UPI003329F836
MGYARLRAALTVGPDRLKVYSYKRPVIRWRKAWREDGTQALLSKGPLAWGYDENQCWTPARVKTLIGRLFHIGYTIEGLGKLLHRHGWSVQVPARRALERDEEAAAAWKQEVWPVVKAPG